MQNPKFGPAGAGDSFYKEGNKHSYEVPGFLSKFELTAFEYQCGRGVSIGNEKAELLGVNAKKYNISLSIHAPYFISLATSDEEKLQKNKKYFLESAAVARNMGATRIVFHPGGLNKQSREEAYLMAEENLKQIMWTLDEQGYGDIIFCPETMGKINQLGNLDEVVRLCKLHENMLPCVDFGHMNSRTQGNVNSFDTFADIFQKIEVELGIEKAKRIHVHFSKIEYNKGGEKRHLTFEDTVFGPQYEPLMELIYQKDYAPTIICESSGTQTEDAGAMLCCYKSYFDSTCMH